MSKSLLILGRQPKIGLAELESLFGPEKITMIGENAAILSIEPEKVDFPRLGGSIKLCRIESEMDTSKWPEIQKYLEKLVPELLGKISGGKIRLGLSVYGSGIQPRQLLAAGLTIKKILRSQGKSIRLVPNQTSALNSAQVIHNKLTNDSGCEIVCVRYDNKTIVAQTVSEQDIESYTLRDRGRPKRDARVGMLPPKLAQIIINLANPSPGSYVLDPFCGTGVILQEALLMDFSVYGSDLEQRMVDFSRTNLDWLLSQNEWLRKNVVSHKSRSIILERQDATRFQAHNAAGIEAVASETYLGRPFTTQPSEPLLKQTASDVNVILTKFLQKIRNQLPENARLCLAVPAWHIHKNDEWKVKNGAHSLATSFVHLPLIDRLSDLGYNHVRFEHVRNGELLYYREDQIVARELLVLTRK